MTRRPDQSRPGVRDHRDPSLLVWLLASVSLVLPWIGIAVAALGILRLGRDLGVGLALIAAGLALIILDIVIDFVWAAPAVWSSDDPDLNRRGHELIGRTAIVADAITAGRGTVRISDTQWIAEGPDLAVGTEVQITGAQGTRLIVAPV